MDKNNLDKILDLHKAQPVGHGYIDIIVSRENFKSFVRDLIDNDFTIKGISWWEWCPNGKECEYGLGGPESNFYKGWFSELPIDVDDIKTFETLKKDDLIEKIFNLIEKKSICYPNEVVTFKLNSWLTPALWLDVPNDWRNKYCA
jgi:hypothetical protein